jgi:hypothetical protein
MRKQKIQTISLSRIQTTVTRSDVQTARAALSFAVGATVDVSGRVVKRVKRSEQCKLVINPDNTPGLTVFADCLADEKTVIGRKIRKGSTVTLHGKLQSFGSQAVCLRDCRLQV